MEAEEIPNPAWSEGRVKGNYKTVAMREALHKKKKNDS